MSARLLVSSFALASLGAWLFARFAGKLSLLDCPNERSSHCQPTPKGGGAGILAAFSLVGMVSGVSLWFWGPISVLSLVAGYGDRVDLPARLRLVTQLGLITLFVLGTWQSTFSYYLSFPLILLWIVFIAGTANFYNFMDGINGIAGITGAVGFSLLAFYLYNRQGQSTLGSLSLCMAFSCFGFLPLNVPKAKIFMGDIGSILLGAVFGGLVYLTSHTFLDFLCMSSFLFPFYADELITMYIRLRAGENLSTAHRRHLYQLLVNEMGYAHWKISTAYGLTQLIVGIGLIITVPMGWPILAAFMLACSVIFVVFQGRIRKFASMPCKRSC
ncbi:MAG: UDP-N-acetylmuramyl pentapeptide phosphotransferase [Syntrophobacteraceae bacterium]